MAQESESPPSNATQPVLVTVSLAEVPVKPGLPLLWVDEMNLSTREDIPVATLRFYALIAPDQKVEVCRLQTTVQHIRAISEVIQRTCVAPPKPEA